MRNKIFKLQTTHFSVFLVAAVMVLVSVTSCQQRLLTRELISETFTQPGQVEVDILFMFDNSGSIDEEIGFIQSGFLTFADAIGTTNIDYRIGFGLMTVKSQANNTLNNNSNPSDDVPDVAGELISSRGIGEFIDSDDVADNSELLTLISDDIQFIRSDPSMVSVVGKACEAAAHALDTIINPELGLNPTFLRDEAALAVIMVSDEDDAATNARFNDLCPTSVDPDNPFRFPQRADTVSDYLALYREVKGANFSIHGIITLPPTDDVCIAEGVDNDIEDNMGSVNLKEFADLTGGFTASVCTPDYSELLDGLGLRIIELSNSFRLRFPVDLTTLQVFLDGTELAESEYSYDAEGRAIQLTTAPSAGSTINVQYNVDTDNETLGSLLN